ncbi:MAG: hypothetical protein NTW28_16970 [Candidatus Solibacter sp.]|nr:hypothetical protein [Candidatus Solibacter sp.]
MPDQEYPCWLTSQKAFLLHSNRGTTHIADDNIQRIPIDYCTW